MTEIFGGGLPVRKLKSKAILQQPPGVVVDGMVALIFQQGFTRFAPLHYPPPSQIAQRVQAGDYGEKGEAFKHAGQQIREAEPDREVHEVDRTHAAQSEPGALFER